MRHIEEDVLDIASKFDEGFISRDMREMMGERGYPTETNTIPAKLHELHAAGLLFFLKKKEGRFFRYYHHKYRDNFSADERHDSPLFQDSWEAMAEELAVALFLNIQGLLTNDASRDLLHRYNKMRDDYDG